MNVEDEWNLLKNKIQTCTEKFIPKIKSSLRKPKPSSMDEYECRSKKVNKEKAHSLNEIPKF